MRTSDNEPEIGGKLSARVVLNLTLIGVGRGPPAAAMYIDNPTPLDTFPNETDWPWVFIADEDMPQRSGDYGFLGWIRDLPRDYLPKALRQIEKSQNKLAQLVDVCVIVANQAVSHAREPVKETIIFCALICSWHGYAEKTRAHGNGRGWHIRPNTTFLRRLCEAPGWRKTLTLLSERQTQEASLPPTPREIEELLRDDPPSTPPPTTTPPPPPESEVVGSLIATSRDRTILTNPQTGQLYEYVSVETARRYSGTTARWIQKLMKKNSIASQGRGRNRRPNVRSLMSWFPPKE